MINKKPYIEIHNNETICWEGWDNISEEIRKKIQIIDKKKVIICVESYQGTFAEFNLKALKEVISPNVTCKTKDIFKDEQKITQLVKKDVNGNISKVSTNSIEDYFDPEKLEGLRNNIDFIEEGIILIQGVGSHKICKPDIIIYSDISRYEILQRFRRHDISNLGVSNNDASFDELHRWSYLVDWRICDKIKRQLIVKCDYFLETNNWSMPKLAVGDTVRQALEEATQQPFFTASFFDPELWDNGKSAAVDDEDFSWGFDCDMEQNNILLKLGKTLFETPAINVLYYQPEKLLGKAIYRKFGSQMPLRFSFIDSMESDHFKLFFFPSADFLREQYGINLSQNDNLYIMDTKQKATVHVGLQDDISTTYLSEILHKEPNNAELTKLTNGIKVKKHDHIYIPPETIRSIGEKVMILHASLPGDILEFTLFDQEHPERVNENSFEEFVSASSQPFQYNQIQIDEDSSWEQLAPSENQTLDLRRMWFEDVVTLSDIDRIQVFNLVEGEEIKVVCPKDSFPPFIVHYAETFIVPAGVSKVQIVPSKKKKHGLLKGTVRT